MKYLPRYKWHPLLAQVSEGFRGPDVPMVKPETEYRIIVFGGSTAYGAGVPEHETISSYLEQIIQKKNKAVNVINAGQCAFSSSQEFVYLSLFLLDYNPDLAILINGRNDFYFSTLPGWQPHTNYRMMRFTDWYNSQKLTFLGKLKDYLYRRYFPKMPVLEGPVDVAPGIRQYVENVRKMGAIASFCNVPLVTVFQPSIFDTDKVLAAPEKRVLHKLKLGKSFYRQGDYLKYHYFYYRVSLSLKDKLVPSWFIFNDCKDEIFMDDCHLTGKGNRMLAEYIAGKIEKNIENYS